MSVYNKRHLALELSQRLGCTADDAKFMVDGFLKCLISALADGKKIQLNRFGVLEVYERKAKIGRNPKDPDAATYHVPPRNVVRFKPGNELDSAINRSSD